MNHQHFLGLYYGERIDPVIVCQLDPELARALGARVTRVYLSAETLKKQRERHADLAPNDYRALRPALMMGEYRREGPRTAIVLFVDAKLLDWGIRAHVKVTQNSREIYVDSFCKMRDKTYRRELLKPHPILRPHK